MTSLQVELMNPCLCARVCSVALVNLCVLEPVLELVLEPGLEPVLELELEPVLEPVMEPSGWYADWRPLLGQVLQAGL